VVLANLGSESETCVGSRDRLVGVSISFEKNFDQLPFTPPSLVRRIGPSGLWWFTTKSSGYLVEPQNQDWRLSGWRRDPVAPRSFDAGGHMVGSQGSRREDADCREGVVVR
jgi:hypothetical protein